MRRGAIIEVAEAAPAVARVVAEIKKFSKDAATNIYAAIGTTQIKVQTSRGIVAVSRTDSEIYQDDIERVVKASQAIQLAPNRMVIHSITREFIVDGAADIIDPLGLKGNRLESNSLIVDAFAPHVCNVMRSVEKYTGIINEDYTSGGRLDIVITDNSNNRVIIENKIFAGDQKNQLLRYYNFDKRSIILYLTLDIK
jgi:cell division protein FtsA